MKSNTENHRRKKQRKKRHKRLVIQLCGLLFLCAGIVLCGYFLYEGILDRQIFGITKIVEDINSQMVKVEWNSFPNADGYELWVKTKNKDYECVQSIEAGLNTQITVPFDLLVRVKVRPYFRTGDIYTYGNFSEERNYYLSSEKRTYQNKCSGYMIQSRIDEEKGDGYLDVGYEGLRVRRVIQALGLGNGIGMNGSKYTKEISRHVSDFQRAKGINVDGTVGLETWMAMGYSEEEWYRCGTYHSEVRSTNTSSRKDLIEIMIDRAMDYLGDPYVIGASGPEGEDYGVDCSGLVIQALYATGIDMEVITPVSHSRPGHEYESRNIWESPYFKHINVNHRKRGDLIIYQDSLGVVNHVAIYLGDDQVIEAWPDQVQISPMADTRHDNIKGVLRVFY